MAQDTKLLFGRVFTLSTLTILRGITHPRLRRLVDAARLGAMVGAALLRGGRA